VYDNSGRIPVYTNWMTNPGQPDNAGLFSDHDTKSGQQ
jgi:hypothetical protein